MDLYVCVEPAYRETTWAKETLSGIYAKSARHRYPVNLVEREDFENVPDTVIVVGTTPKWIEETLDVLSDGKHNAVTVSCQSRFPRRNASYVLIDHENATADALRYLRNCGRTRTALFGTAAWSYSDGVKTRYFSPSDIFPNEQDLEGTFDAFLAARSAYDSVLCANTFTAVYLIRRLTENGVAVPDDLYVMTFGDSAVAKYSRIPVTCLTLDHSLLGEQSVDVCRYLRQQKESVSLTVKVPCAILPAASTEGRNAALSEEHPTSSLQEPYEAAAIAELQSLEKLLWYREDLDGKILEGLLSGESHGALAERLYISESTLRYRLKRLLNLSGFADTEAMLLTVRRYLKE